LFETDLEFQKGSLRLFIRHSTTFSVEVAATLHSAYKVWS